MVDDPGFPEYTDPNDQRNWPLAIVFLEGFYREIRQKEAFLGMFRTDAGASLVATLGHKSPETTSSRLRVRNQCEDSSRQSGWALLPPSATPLSIQTHLHKAQISHELLRIAEQTFSWLT
jgi:hypothetical protein